MKTTTISQSSVARIYIKTTSWNAINQPRVWSRLSRLGASAGGATSPLRAPPPPPPVCSPPSGGPVRLTGRRRRRPSTSSAAALAVAPDGRLGGQRKCLVEQRRVGSVERVLTGDDQCRWRCAAWRRHRRHNVRLLTPGRRHRRRHRRYSDNIRQHIN